MLVKSFSGAAISLKFGMKQQKNCLNPLNDLTSFGDLGVGQSDIAHAISVLGSVILSPEYSKYRYVVELMIIPKEHWNLLV